MGNWPSKSVRRGVLVGAWQLGLWLPQEREREGVSAKLIERDPARCEMDSKILVAREFKLMVEPHGVFALRFGGQVVPNEHIHTKR